MVGGRRPLEEDNLWWKMTFGGGRPLVEDDLWWKMTFGGEASSKQGRKLIFGMLTVLTNIRSTMVLWCVEVDLQWRTTFSGRRPSVEDDLLWKMTFGGK